MSQDNYFIIKEINFIGYTAKLLVHNVVIIS